MEMKTARERFEELCPIKRDANGNILYDRKGRPTRVMKQELRMGIWLKMATGVKESLQWLQTNPYVVARLLFNKAVERTINFEWHVPEVGRLLISSKIGEIITPFFVEESADPQGRMVRYKRNGKKYREVFTRALEKTWQEALTIESRTSWIHRVPEQVRMQVYQTLGDKYKAVVADLRNGYELHIGGDYRDFAFIYDGNNYVGNFESCMDSSRHDASPAQFYRAIGAKAAWLEKCGEIHARCIVFPSVYVEGRKTPIRMAERAYSDGGNTAMQALLYAKLFAAGEIDYAKAPGCSCNPGKHLLYDEEGELQIEADAASKSSLWFETAVNLRDIDFIPYMDTFKVAKQMENGKYRLSTGCSSGKEEYELTETSGQISGLNTRVGEWIGGEWVDEEDIVICEHCGEHLDCNNAQEEDGNYFCDDNCCDHWHEDRDEVYIAGEWHDKDDVAECAYCWELGLANNMPQDEDGNWFCCTSCMDQYHKERGEVPLGKGEYAKKELCGECEE